MDRPKDKLKYKPYYYLSYLMIGLLESHSPMTKTSYAYHREPCSQIHFQGFEICCRMSKYIYTKCNIESIELTIQNSSLLNSAGNDNKQNSNNVCPTKVAPPHPYKYLPLSKYARYLCPIKVLPHTAVIQAWVIFSFHSRYC